MAERTWWETMTVEGGQLLTQIRKLVHEGNIRRIIIKREGRTIAEFPLTFGVVGVVLAPILAAISAIAAVAARCTIHVERIERADVTEQDRVQPRA